YLIAALLVAVTATSFALVSSVPLARDELTPERAGRHVVAASWLSLVVVAAAAGVFALAGERVARWALGSSYGGGTGAQLGRLLVAAAICGGLAAIAFGLSGVVLDAVAAAFVGLVVYVLVLASWRPVGLRSAWTYARTLR